MNDSAGTLTFDEIRTGRWWATPDGVYAVVHDGMDSDEDDEFACNEYAAVFDPDGALRTNHNAGEALDWFPTPDGARAWCEWHARRRAAGYSR